MLINNKQLLLLVYMKEPKFSFLLVVIPIVLMLLIRIRIYMLDSERQMDDITIITNFVLIIYLNFFFIYFIVVFIVLQMLYMFAYWFSWIETRKRCSMDLERGIVVVLGIFCNSNRFLLWVVFNANFKNMLSLYFRGGC